MAAHLFGWQTKTSFTSVSDTVLACHADRPAATGCDAGRRPHPAYPVVPSRHAAEQVRPGQDRSFRPSPPGPRTSIGDVLDFLDSIPLYGTATTVVCAVLGVLSVVVLVLALPKDRRTRILVLASGLTVLVSVVALVIVLVVLSVPLSEIPVGTMVGVVLILWCLFLGVVDLASHLDRLSTSWHRVWLTVPVAVAVVVGLVAVNASYRIYPDIGSLTPDEPYTKVHADQIPDAAGADGTVAVSDWNPPRTSRGMPDIGTRFSATIPAPASGFQARPAQIYLPPAWFTVPRPRLPVIVLMPGIPGSPDQWFDQGQAAEVSQDYQKNHHGLSPIIAVVDATGSTWNNPVCTDSPRGKVRTYLDQDVPAWLKDRLDADPDRAHWAIGGLSYGGTCALQVGANSPHGYGTVLDFSGERTPVNDADDHAATVRDFFGGSEDAFRAANPEDLFKAHAADGRYRHLRVWFVAGHSDQGAIRDLSALAQVATAAGADVTVRKVPGGHDFGTWRTALKEAFPTVAEQGGL